MPKQQIHSKFLPGFPILRERLWSPAFIMAGVSILSGSAGVQLHGWSFTGVDKLGHLVIFGLLGISWIRSLEPQRISDRGRLMAAVLLTTLFGLIDELHQYTNPLRTFEWADLSADFAGALLAGILYLRNAWLRSVLEADSVSSLRLRLRPKPSK